MSNYRPDPPSNQMQLELPGYSSDGEQLMEDARKWAVTHINEWSWFMRTAQQASERNGEVSVDWLLQNMRYEFRVSVKNAYAPCFARIALEKDPALKFKTNKSKVDGFTTAVL